MNLTSLNVNCSKLEARGTVQSASKRASYLLSGSIRLFNALDHLQLDGCSGRASSRSPSLNMLTPSVDLMRSISKPKTSALIANSSDSRASGSNCQRAAIGYRSRATCRRLRACELGFPTIPAGRLGLWTLGSVELLWAAALRDRHRCSWHVVVGSVGWVTG